MHTLAAADRHTSGTNKAGTTGATRSTKSAAFHTTSARKRHCLTFKSNSVPVACDVIEVSMCTHHAMCVTCRPREGDTANAPSAEVKGVGMQAYMLT